MRNLTRIVARLAVATTALLALVYVSAIAGVVVPLTVVLAVSFPILVLAGFVYIVRSRMPATDWQGLRWWMPLIWVLLIVNSGIVATLANRATSGGHVEQRGGTTVLVTHGRIIRELTPEGVRAIHLWDLRALSGHMLLMLSFVSLSLAAIRERGPDAEPRIGAP